MITTTTLGLAGERGDLPRSRTDWRQLIDDTWGPTDLTLSQRESIFNNFWTTIDHSFACFQDLEVDWDGLYALYHSEIQQPGISKGRFSAIMNQLALALKESHTWITDRDVSYTTPAPGIPLLVPGNIGSVGYFGAALTPMPDGTVLVYDAVPSHPLGLVPGDLVLGYDGRSWDDLYNELLDFELPIQYNGWGCAPSSFHHKWMGSVGMNWHLFDTIDVVKGATGAIERLSTAPLDGAAMTLTATEQLPVPGVPKPAPGEYVSWARIEGTNIGYIYVDGWSEPADVRFEEACREFTVTDPADGLIVDFRRNSGGNMFLSDPGLAILFNEDVETIGFAERCDPDDHLGMCPSPGAPPENYVIHGDPATYFGNPIAVLLGPGAVSSGDQVAYRFRFHPEARLFGKTSSTAFNSPSYMTVPPWYPVRYAWADAYPVADPDEYMTHDEMEIDCSVWLEPQDMPSGTDTVVQYALDWIYGNLPDADADGVGEPCDNCPGLTNASQDDSDLDGAGDMCDCAITDPARYPGAVEVNDGMDNQCPGDAGFGSVDELSGMLRFANRAERNELSWTGQRSATMYEVSRSDSPDFSVGCLAETTQQIYWVDAEMPVAGSIYYYLVRALQPNPGSWGKDSGGVERAPCP